MNLQRHFWPLVALIFRPSMLIASVAIVGAWWLSGVSIDRGAGQGSSVASFGSAAAQEPANDAGQRNSTEKLRVRPSRQALRAGSGVQWLTDFEQAMAQSKETGKPIFWYVPSVTGTFMDRKAEVNRYMLAGPFSWPANIDLINQHFIPLKQVPRKREADQFGIAVYKFIEPGFLVVQPDESLSLVADRLTTLNPEWFYRQLAGLVGVQQNWIEASDPQQTMELGHWFDILGSETLTSVTNETIDALRSSEFIEHRMIAGMLLHYSGMQQEAIDLWANISKDFPEHPLAWKAACEAQRIGPFGRGFEVFGSQINLQNSVVPAGKSLTSSAQVGQYSDAQLWRHGVEFLLRMQDRSGGYFDSDYDFGGTDSLPNVYMAVTGLVGLALLDAVEVESLSDRREQILDAVRRAIAYAVDEKHINFDDRDEILWGQAYRVRFLARAKKLGYPQATMESLQSAVNQLQMLQLNNGTWFHEYPNAFVTGTALVALLDAKNCGATVDMDRVEKGLARLETQRFENGAYPYDVRRPGRNDAGTEKDLAASGGRLSICELARYGWQKAQDSDLEQAIRMSLGYHELLEKALKYDNHTNTYAYGGFFFWYDMQARSEAIGMLPVGPVRDEFISQQRAIVRRLPEIDGCFVDSHELGRCYGTAMGLLSLGTW